MSFIIIIRHPTVAHLSISDSASFVRNSILWAQDGEETGATSDSDIFGPR